MKMRKSLSLLLAIVLILGAVFSPVQAKTFSDVPADAYYSNAVNWALESGITSGTSAATFSPNDTCTRGQVVTFLWRSQGKPEPTTAKNVFRDVKPADFFYKPVLWAVENGITAGTSAHTFSPDETCLKAQVVTFLWRTEGQPQPSAASALAQSYRGTYYENAVGWADENGLLSNMGGAFDAADFCPRSDIVTYLYRFCTEDDFVRLTPTSDTKFRPSDAPEYSGSDFVKINANKPFFSPENLTTDSYEMYGALDRLGRCTTCVACIGKDLMPTADRGDISKIKPTGWHSVKIGGEYLYNRCHLIGFQLSGENANKQNLITGTRYFNLNMLDYENLIAEYVEDYDAHVLYRVTPVFEGNDLLAKGVLMEGMSVEDHGKSVKFCVFMYNVQPGAQMDYATGDAEQAQISQEAPVSTEGQYVLNTNSKVFHKPSCLSVKKISDKNKSIVSCSADKLTEKGYQPCKICKP